MPKNIKMLRDHHVSLHGYDVEKWLAGEIHRDVPDALADDLTHPQTLAAIEITGDKKTDAAAQSDAEAEAKARAEEAVAAEALKEAAAKAALEAAKAATGAGAPKPPKS
jgi:hypothetical protein